MSYDLIIVFINFVFKNRKWLLFYFFMILKYVREKFEVISEIYVRENKWLK